MVAPNSTHLPELSGSTESVTGSLTVDTGLRDLQTFVASLNEASITANEESEVHWVKLPLEAGGTQKVTLSVSKGGTNHGDVGDSAVDVSWMALGR